VREELSVAFGAIAKAITRGGGDEGMAGRAKSRVVSGVILQCRLHAARQIADIASQNNPLWEQAIVRLG
jgi:hypothetical protein